MLVMLPYYSATVFDRNRFSLNCRIYSSLASSTCSSCYSESFRKPHRLNAQSLITRPMLLPRITSRFSSRAGSSMSAANLLRTLSLKMAW